MSDKEIRADAKLKNLHEEALQDLWRFRNPEEGGEKMTMEAICVEVPLRYGFTVSMSTLSAFYAWLRVKRRLDARASLADQLKLELAKNPEVSEEQIKKAGQRLFMAEGIIEKDAKVFADMVKIGQADTKLKQNDKRLKQADKALGHDARRLALLEENAAAAKAKLQALATAAKSTGGLSPETLRQIEEAAGLL
jgi:hypothetical protein